MGFKTEDVPKTWKSVLYVTGVHFGDRLLKLPAGSDDGAGESREYAATLEARTPATEATHCSQSVVSCMQTLRGGNYAFLLSRELQS